MITNVSMNTNSSTMMNVSMMTDVSKSVAALLARVGPLDRLDKGVVALLVRLDGLERFVGLNCLIQLL